MRESSAKSANEAVAPGGIGAREVSERLTAFLTSTEQYRKGSKPRLNNIVPGHTDRRCGHVLQALCKTVGAVCRCCRRFLLWPFGKSEVAGREMAKCVSANIASIG